MRSAGARALQVDDNDIPSDDRAAVLSAWEQKSLIDESPLRTRRFQRTNASQTTSGPAPTAGPIAERRTVTITGHPADRVQPRRPRRRSAAQHQLVAQPDRVALWAFLLGLFLVFVAAATATASPL
jgi:hypothetical protein